MTRVEEDREAQRAQEQARVAKEAEKAKRTQNDDFKRQMTKQQTASQDASRKQQQAQGEKRTAGQALLARQGIASRNLSQSLQARGDQAVEHARVQGKERRSDNNDKADDSHERNQKLDKQEQLRDQRNAPISRDDGQRGEKGSGGGGGASAEGGGGDGQQQRQTPITGAQAQAAKGPQGPQIPPEAFRELIKQAFAGITPEGLHQVTVELAGFFDGVRVDVTAKDGKISCTFFTPSGRDDLRKLLKASEGPLARALDTKKMRLERLAVE